MTFLEIENLVIEFQTSTGPRPVSLRNRFMSIGSLALYAVPGFWLALVLTIVF